MKGLFPPSSIVMRRMLLALAHCCIKSLPTAVCHPASVAKFNGGQKDAQIQ